MSFNTVVKEKIARTIGDYFTTNQIVNVFSDANIQTDKELFAKWRIILNAFSKMSDQETAIPYILLVFCHPLNFQEPQFRSSFIEKLNEMLAYENLEIKATDRSAKMFLGGVPINSSQNDIIGPTKTSIDYVTEALNFFKNEYNKTKMSGLTYEYSLGENISSHEIENGREGYEEKLKAIEQLKNAGFITAYTVDGRAEGDDWSLTWGWDYAVCKIDESKIAPKETLPATETKVNELIHKIEITSIPPIRMATEKDESIKPNRATLKGKQVEYDETKSVILVDGKSCPLPPAKNEDYFARAMFSRPIGEFVDWSLIYPEMTGSEVADGHRNQKSVRDTMDRLNKRIQDLVRTADELFTWQNKSLKRNY